MYGPRTGGSGKELVGKGSGTVRARLAWAQFYKRNTLNEISEKLLNLLKKVEGGHFYKRNPLKKFSENIKILLKLEKNVQKRRVPRDVLTDLTFSMIFKKRISP